MSPLAWYACTTYQASLALAPTAWGDGARHTTACQATVAAIRALCGNLCCGDIIAHAARAESALGPSADGVWDWEAFVHQARLTPEPY